MQNSEVRELRTGKRDAIHETSETNKDTLESRLSFLYLILVSHALLHLLSVSTHFHDTSEINIQAQTAA